MNSSNIESRPCGLNGYGRRPFKAKDAGSNPVGAASVLERFNSKYEEDENGCWVWIGAMSSVGYGRFKVSGRLVSPHRWSYENFVGPIPENLVIDHLCRNRRCVNPQHLEAVSHRENVLRGIGPTAFNARKTHCPSGHLLSGPNLYLTPQGRRACFECQRLRNAVRDGRSL